MENRFWLLAERLCTAAVCILGMLSLAGCSNLVPTLVSRAGEYADSQLASGITEAAYYLEPPLYDIKELLVSYTAGYAVVEWEESSADSRLPVWREEDAVRSDECVSSRIELDGLLEQALEDAALGVELQFDRAKYLPDGAYLQQWIQEYAQANILTTLCLNRVVMQTAEEGFGRTVYLSLYYDLGREEVLSLREETDSAVKALAKQLREEAEALQPEAEAQGESLSEEQALTLALWQYLTANVSYPPELLQREPVESAEDETEAAIPAAYLRPDSALTAKVACGQGMARAAKLLLDELGLENEITIETGKQEQTRRFWNRVRLEDGWYRMDVCFGAATQGNRDFFEREPASE